MLVYDINISLERVQGFHIILRLKKETHLHLFDTQTKTALAVKIIVYDEFTLDRLMLLLGSVKN